MAGRRPRRLRSELHSRSWTLMSRHNYLTPLQNLALHEAVGIVRRGFGQADYAEVFLVGSCLQKQNFRDVDVRLILSNGAYDYLFAHDDEAGSLWREQLRHEYDHHLGYGAAHHEHVEAVCSRCHHRRAEERKETWWLRGKD